MFRPQDLLDLAQFQFPELFDGCEHAWDALKRIGDFCKDGELIGKGTVIEEGATIKGPVIIGRDCEIRANAYIRGNVIVGDNCVLGNASEFKNCILFNGSQAPHFNYVGDSILGHKAHIGAGVVLSNFKSLPGNIKIELDGTPFDTGLRKFGALLGDFAEVGCNSVLNPGSIVGRNSLIYPASNWRGILAANMIAKNKSIFDVVRRFSNEP